VLLGNPGSGKTTLGRWLVLQYAQALKDDKERVQVSAATVRPGADATCLDLDIARVPIPVRIVDYANERWGNERWKVKLSPDLTLVRFIENGLYLDAKTLQSPFTQAHGGALAGAALAQGRALVILPQWLG